MSDYRNVLRKIELAQSDLAISINDLFQGIAERVEKLENAADGTPEIEVCESLSTAANELHAAHRRIADLEVRIEDLEKELQAAENDRHHMQNQITAAHRRLDEVSRMDHRRIADLGKRIDDLENDGLDNTRTIVADMINDGDIRLHVD